MTKEEIIDYILNSPENTNSNVLKGMLDQLDNGGGGDYKFVEVARQEEFEWEQEKGNDWSATNSSFDIDELEPGFYAVKMIPYINELVSVRFNENDFRAYVETDSFSNYVVYISAGEQEQIILISSFDSTPEVESIILYKLVPVNYQENEEVEPPSMEEAQ